MLPHSKSRRLVDRDRCFDQGRTAGDVAAQTNLARCLSRQSRPNDYAEAARWLRAPANQGDVIAQFLLDGCIFKQRSPSGLCGSGSAASQAGGAGECCRAVYMERCIAAEPGPAGLCRSGEMVSKTSRTRQRRRAVLSGIHVSSRQRSPQKHVERRSGLQSGRARQCRGTGEPGSMYFRSGKTPRLREAANWSRKRRNKAMPSRRRTGDDVSSSKGHPEPCRSGQMVPQGAEQGDAMAQATWVDVSSGQGVLRTRGSGEMVSKAAEQGHSAAQVALGSCISRIRGPLNYAEAEKWFARRRIKATAPRRACWDRSVPKSKRTTWKLHW